FAGNGRSRVFRRTRSLGTRLPSGPFSSIPVVQWEERHDPPGYLWPDQAGRVVAGAASRRRHLRVWSSAAAYFGKTDVRALVGARYHLVRHHRVLSRPGPDRRSAARRNDARRPPVDGSALGTRALFRALEPIRSPRRGQAGGDR